LKNKNNPLAALVLVGALAATLLTGCGVESIKWTEEVLLADGRKVDVRRYQEFGGNYEPGQSATISTYWLEFTNPDTNEKIKYQGSKELRTAALFSHQSRIYLILSIGLGGSRYTEGCPNPPYIFFEYRDGQWKRISYAQSPVKKIEKNMVSDAKSSLERIKNNRHYLIASEVRKDVEMHDAWPSTIDITGLDSPKLECPQQQKTPAPGK